MASRKLTQDEALAMADGLMRLFQGFGAPEQSPETRAVVGLGVIFAAALFLGNRPKVRASVKASSALFPRPPLTPSQRRAAFRVVQGGKA